MRGKTIEKYLKTRRELASKMPGSSGWVSSNE